MAKLKANKRPIPRRHDNRVFTGTCSNCRDKEVLITKVGSAQVCINKCMISVDYSPLEGIDGPPVSTDSAGPAGA